MRNSERQFHSLTSGRRICFAEYGARDGKPLFFFHGWPSSRIQARMWHRHAEELGVRLIAPDRPGVGRSDFVDARELLDWPPVVVELADHLGLEQFAVVGVSGGGPYALACAATLPERVERAEIVCGAPPLAKFTDRSEMMWPYRALLWLRPRTHRFFPPLLWLARVCSKIPSHRPPLSWAIRWTGRADREVLLSGDYPEFAESFREGLQGGATGIMTDGDVYSSDWRIDFQQVITPVQIWHGEEDQNIPLAMVREYASWIPSATLKTFADEGHYSIAVNATREVLLSALSGHSE